MTTADDIGLTVGALVDDYRQIRTVLSNTDSPNSSGTDFLPVTGLIASVEPHGQYLIEYFLKLDVAPGAGGISTLADGPVGSTILMQDGAAFQHGINETDTMLVVLHGLITTADIGGHAVLYFVPVPNNKLITVRAGSAARVTRLG